MRFHFLVQIDVAFPTRIRLLPEGMLPHGLVWIAAAGEKSMMPLLAKYKIPSEMDVAYQCYKWMDWIGIG